MSLMQRRVLFLLCLIPLLALSSLKVALAQGPLTLTERQGEYKVGKYLTYLEDPSGNLTIEDVTSPKYAAQFRQRNEEVPNFGFTNSAYWIRFEVQNQANLAPVWLLELAFGNVHRLDLYLPSPNQRSFLVKHSGNLLPFNSREFAYHNPIFKLPLALNQTTTIYLRAKNGSATFFPLTLWSLETFAQKQATAELGWGLFYGILLILLGYNFLLFLSLRDKAYLSLPVFIISYLIHHSSVHGFTTQYLWPTVGGIDLFIVPFFMGLCLVTGLDFLMAALATKTHVPTLHKIASFLKWPAWLFIGLIPFVSYGMIIKLMSALVVLISFFGAWTSLSVALRGYRPARYFILGLLVITIREVLVNFVRSDLIPTNEALEWSFEFLVMLVMFLFSLTLVDRVNMLHHEKERAKKKEAALREREELFRSMFETHSAVMYLVDPENGQIVEANWSAVNYYGYPLEKLKTLTIYAINQCSPTEIQQKFLQTKTGKRKAFQFPHRLANGEIRTVEVYSTPIKFREQTLLFSIVHDVTERERAEEALRRSEDHYRLLAENSTDVIWVMSLAGQITYVSPSVEKLRGYTPQEVLQQTMAEVMTPAALALVKDQITHSVSAIQNANKSFISGSHEIEQPCKDGRTVLTEAVITVLFDEAGKISSFLGVSRDITERKQFERQLQKANDRFRAELAFARKIQQNLLQPACPAWPKLKVLCFNAPAREVSGDFYDYLAFTSSSGEPKYTLVVGDVTGKGMPAALFMAVSIALLRSIAPQELSPSLLLTNLDQQLENYTKEDRMNCALCCIEITLPTPGTERALARIANGGLIPPFFKPCTGQAELLDVVGPPLGTGFGAMLGYLEKTIDLAPGAMLILTSDGLVEAMNPQGELLGFERTLALIQAGPNRAEAMMTYLKTEVATFMGGSEPHDDITIVVIQI